MTEVEWLACADPAAMLRFVESTASKRKLRLFACICGRSIWNCFADERSKHAIVVAEQFADGQATHEGLAAAHRAAVAAHDDPTVPHHMVEGAAIAAAFAVCQICAEETPERVYFTAAVVLDPFAASEGLRDIAAAHAPFYRKQADFLRDLLGNPFRTVTVDPAWLTPTVVSLATTIYDERAFDRLPILADAMEDAGCTNSDLLNHCRQPAEHARGCWAVDLLLGKQ